MTFLEYRDVEVMDCQAKGPDMNPIEHIWDQMAIKIRDMDKSPTAQLCAAVTAAWDAVRPGTLGCVLFKALMEGTHDIDLWQV